MNVVITGASSGIGAALAKRLASDGHKLVIAGRREGKLQAAARACSGAATAVPTDVTIKAQVSKLFDMAKASMGHIDVWVNNAGRGIGRKVEELTENELDEMMAVNVKGALWGMQAVLPHFVERKKGHIVNVCAFLGRVPLASHRSAYSAAAAALTSLSANLRMDLKSSQPDVNVSVIFPGLVSDSGFAAALIGSKLAPAGKMPSQTSDEVAQIIAGVMTTPKAETYTTPVLRALLNQYQADVEGFEQAMAPMPTLQAPGLAGLAERLKIKGS